MRSATYHGLGLWVLRVRRPLLEATETNLLCDYSDGLRCGICLSDNGHCKLHYVDIPYLPSFWMWLLDYLEVHPQLREVVSFSTVP